MTAGVLLPVGAGRGIFLAIIFDLSEVRVPFFNDFLISRFNDAHDDFQLTIWDVGTIVTQKASSLLRDPNLRCVFRGNALGNMHMDRLQGSGFVRPEVNQV